MGVKIDIPSGSPFTIHNIPFGVISTGENKTPRCASAIGEYAIDLDIYSSHGRLDSVAGLPSGVFAQGGLNAFAALPLATRRAVRNRLIDDIKTGELPNECLLKLDSVTMHLPFAISEYTDFYCSLEHVQNCSPMAHGITIPVNWFHAPSCYNARSSSVIPSPHPIRRPRGFFFDNDSIPTYAASQEMDYELEMGYFISKPVEYGSTLDIEHVEEHIFGFVLLNDWSSRDLQIFEMKPLGPFHGKGFGTSISPWVVTLDALQPFRCKPKTVQDPAPVKHLNWPGVDDGTFDIKLKVELIRDEKHITLGTSNLRYLYWTPFQQAAHHASAMCGLRTGDLMGTGTISGDGVDSDGNKTELGCLYEATHAGTKTLELKDGFSMKYLHDGDEIILSAYCGEPGEGEEISLGFGDCRGVILPAQSA